MSRFSVHRPNPHFLVEGREFADDSGRKWNASYTGEAIVFACVSDNRQSGRAIAITPIELAADVSDEVLREWLSSAPRIGQLT